jgi:hypothetical protein
MCVVALCLVEDEQSSRFNARLLFVPLLAAGWLALLGTAVAVSLHTDYGSARSPARE